MQLQDGDSDTWLDVRQVGKRAFQFVEIMDLHSATGDNTGDRYSGEVVLVDLEQLTDKQIADAKRSCGWEGMPDSDAAVAEMCYSYGCKAHIWSDGGTSRVRLHRAARSAAKELLDPDALDAAMERPVNKLGSTAREFMTGDIYSAMQRGCESGDPAARIISKMYGVPQGVIDDTRPVDWLPYLVGYTAASSGHPKDTADNEDDSIVPEYHRGWDRGERVRKGECPAPSWIIQQKGDSSATASQVQPDEGGGKPPSDDSAGGQPV